MTADLVSKIADRKLCTHEWVRAGDREVSVWLCLQCGLQSDRDPRAYRDATGERVLPATPPSSNQQFHTCPDCKCQFVQPFVCTTCGAQKLYDETVRSQAATIEHLRHAFKNFHRQLCERFNYCHDEIDWQRDQVSLIEWIAEQTKHPETKAEPTEIDLLKAALLQCYCYYSDGPLHSGWIYHLIPDTEQECKRLGHLMRQQSAVKTEARCLCKDFAHPACPVHR